MHDLGRVGIREGRQRNRRRIHLAAAPLRSTGQQLGPARPDQQDRQSRACRGERVQKVQQSIVGPVQVLDHEHAWPTFGECFEEALPSRKGILRPSPVAGFAAGEADERTEVSLDPFDVLIRYQ